MAPVRFTHPPWLVTFLKAVFGALSRNSTKGPFGVVSEFRASGTVGGRYCSALSAIGPPDAWLKPASSQGKRQSFPTCMADLSPLKLLHSMKVRAFLPLDRPSHSEPFGFSGLRTTPRRRLECAGSRAVGRRRLLGSWRFAAPLLREDPNALETLADIGPGRLGRLRLSAKPGAYPSQNPIKPGYRRNPAQSRILKSWP